MSTKDGEEIWGRLGGIWQAGRAHPPGWLVCYRPALQSGAHDRWYSTEGAAMAALAALGGREVYGRPRERDLTESGCAESRAFVVETRGGRAFERLGDLQHAGAGHREA